MTDLVRNKQNVCSADSNMKTRFSDHKSRIKNNDKIVE